MTDELQNIFYLMAKHSGFIIFLKQTRLNYLKVIFFTSHEDENME